MFISIGSLLFEMQAFPFHFIRLVHFQFKARITNDRILFNESKLFYIALPFSFAYLAAEKCALKRIHEETFGDIVEERGLIVFHGIPQSAREVAKK